MTDVLGRPRGRVIPAEDRGPPNRDLLEAITIDLQAPPPLLLLPMRLEYRVVEPNVPIRVAGHVRTLFNNDATGSVEVAAPEPPAVGAAGGRAHGRPNSWRLDATAVTLN